MGRGIVQFQPAVWQTEVEEALHYEQQRYWRIDYALKTDFKIENISFIHDPAWRESFFSIQGIIDVQHGTYDRVTPRVVTWKIVGIFFDIAATVFTGGGWLLRPSNRFFLACRNAEQRFLMWRMERALRNFRQEQRENAIRRCEEVMANVRDNMQAKRNRVRITVAGNVYKIGRVA